MGKFLMMVDPALMLGERETDKKLRMTDQFF